MLCSLQMGAGEMWGMWEMRAQDFQACGVFQVTCLTSLYIKCSFEDCYLHTATASLFCNLPRIRFKMGNCCATQMGSCC